MPKKQRKTEAVRAKRRFVILHVNCRCASYDWARSPLRSKNFSLCRCRFCRKSLGWMEVKILGHVTALNEPDAYKRFAAKGKVKCARSR